MSNWPPCTSYKKWEFVVVDVMIRYTSIWSSRFLFYCCCSDESHSAEKLSKTVRQTAAKDLVLPQETHCARFRAENKVLKRDERPIVCICLLVLPHTYILCPYRRTRNPFPTCLTFLQTRPSRYTHSTYRKICAVPRAKWRTWNFQVENVPILHIRKEIQIYTENYEWDKGTFHCFIIQH